MFGSGIYVVGEIMNLPAGGVHSWRDGIVRSPLPIDGSLQTIIDATKEHQVIIVEAETGSGKTTRLGQALVDFLPKLKVWLSQPRRNAVRWNGRRIADEMQVQPGQTVGWRLAGEEPTVSEDTRLMLLVDQSLSNLLLRMEDRLPEGVLIVDEAHERKLTTDLLLGMIRERLDNSPNTKVVVMSATLDVEKFSAFFGGAPIYRIPGRCFPVTRKVEMLYRGEPHSAGACRVMENVMADFASGNLLVPTEDGRAEQSISFGTVLMLLPGKEDIRNARERFEEQARLYPDTKFEFFECHGEMDGASQDAIQSEVPADTLRICAGTEILRASVTIPSTYVVIDALRVKRLFVDSKGVAHLQTIAISKAESDQGAGRAGRTNPGVYYALSAGQEFNTLSTNAMPEILQAPLTSAVLQVAAMGLNARTFSWVDAPPSDQLEVAFTRLKRLGALDSKERITELGEELMRFPLDPEKAMTLITAEKLGVLPEAMILTSCVESGNFFFRPRNREDSVLVEEQVLRFLLAHLEDASYGFCLAGIVRPDSEVSLEILPEWVEDQGNGTYRINCGHGFFPHREGAKWLADIRKKLWARNGEGDFFALVNAYRAYKAEERRIRDNPEFEIVGKGKDQKRVMVKLGKRLEAWCRLNFINRKSLKNAEHTLQQLKDEISTMSPLSLTAPIAKSRKFSSEDLTKSFLSGHPDFVAHCQEGNCSGPIGFFSLSFGSTCPRTSQMVVVAGVQKVPVRGGYIQLADLVAPVEPHWFKEAAPQLCRQSPVEEPCFDRNSDAVLQLTDFYFGEFVIGRQLVPVRDKEVATRAFASYLIGNNAVNAAIVSLADRLNQRAGKQVFPTRDEFVAQLVQRLSGATCFAEIVDGQNSSELSPLDQGEVQKVQTENPDLIEIGGRSLGIDYTNDYPLVTISRSDDCAFLAKLPDEVALPNGKKVSFRFEFAYQSYTEETTVLGPFKKNVADQKARSAFSSWTRPMIELPDFAIEGQEVPEVYKWQYGRHLLTGMPLYVYGAVTFSRGSFVVLCCESEEDALLTRDATVRHVTVLQAETRKRRLEEEKRQRMEREIASGQAMRDFSFSAVTAGATNGSNAWVISKDGTLRDPDSISSGKFCWDFVGPDELILTWECSHIEDVDGNSTFNVVKQASSLSDEQLAAVKRVEESIGATPGMFGFDQAFLDQRKNLLEALKTEVPRTPLGDLIQWTPEAVTSLCGANGFWVDSKQLFKLVDHSKPFDQWCHNREAQIIKTYYVGDDGVVEALAFQKFANWKLSLRYRKLRDGEVSSIEETEEPAIPPKFSGLFGGTATVQPTSKKKKGGK